MDGAIVGLGGSCHDYSAAAVVDGRLVGAIADERLSRVRYALDGSCDRPYRYLADLLGGQATSGEATFFGNEMLDARALPAAARAGRYHALQHHLTHAAWAFFSSPFERAAVLVADGSGSVTRRGTSSHTRETTSYWHGSGSGLTLLGRVEGGRVGPAERNEMDALTSNSIGDLYQAVTMALGFSAMQAGKTMALAAYGDDRYVGLFRDHVALGGAGQFSLRLHDRSRLVEQITAISRRARQRSDFGALASLARAGQVLVEELLTHCLQHLAAVTGETALCFGGGVALNAVYAGKIGKCTPFTRVHIPFAPGDDGTALGAAVLGHLELFGTLPTGLSSPFLGRRYTEADCRSAAVDASELELAISWPGDIVEAVSEELHSGRVVAWFRGESEFGPRALGHRSILAWPGDTAVRDFLNRRVKGREWFRPFAPMMPADRAGEFCDVSVASPFMQFAAPLRPSVADRVPAVCHVDGSARVQTVSAATAPLLASLLDRVERWAGLPIVLNTSLNGPGEPIVETPAQAVDCFARSGLDSLALGDLLIRRV